MAQIRIREAHKLYGESHAVRGVDIDIASGEFVVILGPSGCGKSTLLRMIAGLEDISAGTVEIAGEVVNALPPAARGCAMVFQNYALYPHMTVAGNIGYALRVAGVGRAERAARVQRIAQLLELGHLLDRRPAQLSGGQRQRVAMGRAMVREPRVFLFDEPLSNLDARLRVQVRLEIRRLHRSLGATSVFVTHDQFEAMTMADRLVVMNAGRVEQAGTPQEIYRRPATLFVAGFVGTPNMNLLAARIGAGGRVLVGAGWCPCPDGAWDLPEGTEVMLGVRPGEVIDLPAGHGAAPLFAPDLVEDAGSEVHLHARGLGPDIAAITLARPAGAALPGERFAITIPAAAAHVFRADTGARAAARPQPQRQTQHEDAPWNATRPSSI